MPPKAAGGPAAVRKGSQFKPPRPVKAPAQAPAAKRAPTTAASRAATASKTNASAAQPGFQSANATVISSDEEQDDGHADDSDDMMDMDDEDAPARAKPTRADSLSTPPVPAPLLARLLLENFEDSNTQIQKGAMNLTSRYMEIFVREALARAKHERARSAKNDGITDGFLQVEDLERLAPQLMLDF
jgi:hypothetical protein